MCEVGAGCRRETNALTASRASAAFSGRQTKSVRVSPSGDKVMRMRSFMAFTPSRELSG